MVKVFENRLNSLATTEKLIIAQLWSRELMKMFENPQNFHTLQKPAFSLFESRLALGTPGCLVDCLSSSCRKWPNTLPPSDCIHRWNPFPEQTRKRSWRGILSPTRLLHSWHRVLLWLALNFCTEFYQVQVHVNRRSIEAMNGKDLLHLYIAHLFWYAPAFKKVPLFPFFTLVEVMRITGSPNFS